MAAEVTFYYLLTRGYGNLVLDDDEKFIPTRGYLASDDGGSGGGSGGSGAGSVVGENRLVGV